MLSSAPTEPPKINSFHAGMDLTMTTTKGGRKKEEGKRKREEGRKKKYSQVGSGEIR